MNARRALPLLLSGAVGGIASATATRLWSTSYQPLLRLVIGYRLRYRRQDGGDVPSSTPQASLPLAASLLHEKESHLRDVHYPETVTRGLTPYFLADAAARASPAVVNITLHHEVADDQLPDWFGRFQDRSSGSGVVFDEEGLILTNYHVVSEAISTERQSRRCTLVVSLQDGRVFDAKVVNFDRTSDLALLRVESDEKLPVAKLGSSKALRVGEFVIALGSPLHLRNSVTAGIISCTDRKSKELGLSGSNGVDYIQTDAAINNGNSGGPLINIQGEVIGINNMKVMAADGVSFAIPVDTAKQVIAQLTLQGRVSRPFIGIKMLQLNSYIAKAPGNLSMFRIEQLMTTSPQFPNVESGILVPEVAKGSPAERAGLQPGDVIIGFSGSKSEVTTAALIEELGRHIGTSLELRVARKSLHGKQHEIRLHVIATRAE